MACRAATRSPLPAVATHERDESDGADVARLDARVGAAEHAQHLLLTAPNGDEQPSTDRELLEQGCRHVRASRTDEDRVVGRVLAPPDRAVAEEERDVLRAEPLSH